MGNSFLLQNWGPSTWSHDWKKFGGGGNLATTPMFTRYAHNFELVFAMKDSFCVKLCWICEYIISLKLQCSCKLHAINESCVFVLVVLDLVLKGVKFVWIVVIMLLSLKIKSIICVLLCIVNTFSGNWCGH